MDNYLQKMMNKRFVKEVDSLPEEEKLVIKHFTERLPISRNMMKLRQN